jgi:hypothetical protein
MCSDQKQLGNVGIYWVLDLCQSEEAGGFAEMGTAKPMRGRPFPCDSRQQLLMK